ncbi:hypothetical protein GF412_00675 [Candidatus Micrarchaeota archaeon]|nr:hypothetical protein [Candidatus Micrarchaeota archaeon]MBD3417487.1 hypothetical protein [Candidatus Micrarchaeota archaeon]
MKKQKAEKKKTEMESTPTRVEDETQQLEQLLYLLANAMDAKLDRGFSGGVMLKKGGGHSDYAFMLGIGLVEGSTTDERAIETLVEHTKTEKKRTAALKKMRKLFKKLSEGRRTTRPERYISFRNAAKAKAAEELLESYGFAVRRKKGAKGFEITGLPKDAGKALKKVKKDVLKRAEQAYLQNEDAGRAAKQRMREKTMKELYLDLERTELASKRARRAKDYRKITMPPKEEKEGEEYSKEGIAKIDVYDACWEIENHLFEKHTPSSLERLRIAQLLQRKDVLKELRHYGAFDLFTNEEFKAVVSSLKGGRGLARTKIKGTEFAELRARRAKGREGASPLAKPWKPVTELEEESIKALEKGQKASFVRNSYESAAQTIAELEQRYPRRAVTWKHTPEFRGGKDRGEWIITVEKPGTKPPSAREWILSTFPREARNRDFYSAVTKSIRGEEAAITFTSESIPRWMSTALDAGKSKKELLVFRDTFRRKLASKGIIIPKELKGKRKSRIEGGRRVYYYSFTLPFSGKDFGGKLEVARADAKKRRIPRLKEVTFGEGNAVARRSGRPLEKRVAEKIAAMRKEEEARLASRGKKKKGKKEKKA